MYVAAVMGSESDPIDLWAPMEQVKVISLVQLGK